MLKPGFASYKKIKTPPTFSTLAALYATGTCTAGSTVGSDQVVNVPIPDVAITAGWDILIHASTKTSKMQPTRPTGFRRLDTYRAASVGNGGDQGASVAHLFLKKANGTERNTTVPITLPGGNSIQATVYIISKDPSAELHYKFCGGHHNVLNTVNYSARSWNKIDLETDDLVLALTSVNTDNYDWGSQNLAI
jgi:hypothetical protein